MEEGASLAFPGAGVGSAGPLESSQLADDDADEQEQQRVEDEGLHRG